jgi:hypothetical protein
MPDFSGLDLDALIVGLMAASFVTFWLDTVNDPLKAGSAILFSALLSGYGGPVVSVYAMGKVPVLVGADGALSALAAVLIGSSVTWGLPILINYVRNKWGGSNA